MINQSKINLLNNIINNDDKIVYLVGAGISMDPPSSLPSAIQFSRILLGFSTPKEEVETLLSLPGLRYEMVVERIQKNFDKNLDFLNYLELITSPNIVHFYLGWEIINRHPVITTNFDFLIEYALKQILPESQHVKIFPVITKQEYLENQNYREVYEKDTFPLYKIHGSKKNLITGENTTSSLITTLTSLGRNREEGETFAIEPFKKGTVHNLLDGGTLIVMGYSGSDTFDIGPLLENFPTLKQMIWIDHDVDKEIAIQEILPGNEFNSKKISTCDRLLLNIRNSNSYKIYRIKTNTAEFISTFLWSQLLTNTPPEINFHTTHESKPIDFKTWVEPIFTGINDLRKYNIVIKLYDELGNIEKALECAQKGLQLAEQEEDQKFKSIYLNDIGILKVQKGDYNEALKLMEEALEISKKLNSKFVIGQRLNSLGFIHTMRGDLQKALEFLEEAKKIFEEVQNLRALANTLNNIGTIHNDLDEIEKALDHYEAALLLEEKIGNLSGKATLLNNIGDLYSMKLKDFDKALMYHQEALKINEELGNLPKQALNLSNIATVYSYKKRNSQAYEMYLKALKIFTEIGDLDKISGIYSNLGDLREEENNIEEAIDWTIKALRINDKLGNNIHKSETQIQLGKLYIKQNDLNSAISIFQDAFNSAKKVNYTIYMLSSLYNLAEAYYDLGKCDDAISTYTRAINLAEESNKKSSQATYSNNLGTIYLDLEKFELAINTFKSALELEKKLGNKERVLVILGNMADSYRRSNELNIATEYYGKALKLAHDLGDREESAAILREIGLNLTNQSKFSEAINTFGDLMRLYRDLKDPNGLQKTLGSLGYCTVAIGDYLNAKIFCEKALVLAKKLNLQEDIQVQQENLEFINRKLDE